MNLIFIKKKFSLRLTILSFSLILLNSTYAGNNGRYISVVDKPKPAQIELLSQKIHVKFPESVKTIGDAMNYLLQYSGYSLVANSKRSAAIKITLSKPLPLIDRDFGSMTLADGLRTLAGSIFTLVQDPLNRTVDFKLKSEFNSRHKK